MSACSTGRFPPLRVLIRVLYILGEPLLLPFQFLEAVSELFEHLPGGSRLVHLHFLLEPAKLIHRLLLPRHRLLLILPVHFLRRPLHLAGRVIEPLLHLPRHLRIVPRHLAHLLGKLFGFLPELVLLAFQPVELPFVLFLLHHAPARLFRELALPLGKLFHFLQRVVDLLVLLLLLLPFLLHLVLVLTDVKLEVLQFGHPLLVALAAR